MWQGIMLHLVDTTYRGKVLYQRGGVSCFMWWTRHTKVGYYVNMVGIGAFRFGSVSEMTDIKEET